MPIKMLVVDDEPDLESLIRQKFRKQIREKEYEFLFAQDGGDALEKMQQNQDIAMILSDINMPGMDGLTLLQKMSELKNPALKAVIVSAYGDMENIRTAMNRGAFDFVTKPIDFTDLEITISKTIQQTEQIKRALKEHDQLVAVQRDLGIATRIQQSILPRKFPPFPDRKEFEIYAEMHPAKEVGGDFYDFFFVDGERLAFVVGDVSGKGVPAALFMAVSRTLLRSVAHQEKDPARCLKRVNSMLLEGSDGSMFVTVFFALLNTKTGEVLFSNGGHNPPYIVSSDKDVKSIETTGGLFLGMIDNAEYEMGQLVLEQGDTLFTYTDGVTEAMNANHDQFTEERLVGCLRRFNGSSLVDAMKSTYKELKAFSESAPQSDDITMLGIRYLGHPDNP